MQGFKNIAGIVVCVVCTTVAVAGIGDQVARLGQLGVDLEGVQSLVDQMEVREISPELQAIHLDRLATLAVSGLPVGTVLNRYLEGFAKGVPLSRIDPVVKALSAQLVESARYVDASLQEAQVELEPRGRLEAIDQAAYALGVGVHEADLSRSLDLAGVSLRDGYNWSAPLITMSVLVSAGISSDQSLALLNTAWDKGYRGRELELLGRAVAGLDKSVEGADAVVDLLVSDYSLDAVFQNLESLQGMPKNGFTPGEIHDPPSGKHILPRKDKDPKPVSSQS